MADNTITFTIGSVFKGEGFKQARQAVQNVSGDVKRAAATVGAMASSIGMMDAKFLKATNAVAGLTNALTSGNPILATFQVSLVAINGVCALFQQRLDKVAETARKAAEAQERARDAMVKAYTDEQAAQMQKQLEIIKQTGEEFDKITKAANEYTAAINKLTATRSQGEILQMQIDKLFDVGSAGGADAGLVAAKKDYEIVLKQNAERERQAQAAIDAANKGRIDAQGKIENIDLQIRDLEGIHADLLEQQNTKGKINVKIRDELNKEDEEVLKRIKALQAEREKVEGQLTTAQYAVRQAEEEAKNAVLQGTYNRVKAQQAITDAQDAVARAELEAAEAAKKEAAAKRAAAERELQAQFNAAQAAAAAALNNAAGAGAALQAAQDAWNANINANLVNERIQGFFKNGGLDQIANRLNLQSKEDQAAAAAAAVEQGIKDGSLRTLAQANRAARDAERAQRDYASSQQARQEAQDERRRQQLQKEADRAAETGRKLDPRKQAELDRLNALQAGKNKAKADLDAAKKAEAEAAQNIKKTAQAVEAIKKKMEQLGLQ